MNEHFWLENINCLFQSPHIVPTFENASFENQMNCLTRLIVLVSFGLCFFLGWKDFRFMICLLFVLILVYYSVKPFHPKHQQQEIIKECYGDVPAVVEPVPKIPWNTNTNSFVFSNDNTHARQNCGGATSSADCVSNQKNPLGYEFSWQNFSNPQWVDTNSSLAWCPQDIPFEETIGENQKLVGPPNPKTLVRPVIPVPIFAKQQNDFISFPQINEQKRQELYSNGYMSVFPLDPYSSLSTNMKENYDDFTTLPSNLHHHQKNENNSKYPLYNLPSLDTHNYPPAYSPPYSHRYPSSYYPQVEKGTPYLQPDEGISSYSSSSLLSPNNYKNRYETLNIPSIDMGCGYQPVNLEYNLPINYQASQCQKTPQASSYNQDLFSIPLQPGIYTKNQVNDPMASMSNLGISYQSQFQPSILQNYGPYKEFVHYDPNLYPPQVSTNSSFQSNGQPQIFRNEIYDPRLTGYGTSYRSYIDPLLGQPQFFYKDIDAYTQPNYISRNNIDFTSVGASVGNLQQTPLQGGNLHSCVDNTFTDSTIGFRTELQDRLMTKNTNREWQQRIAPISTMNRANASGGKSSASTYAGPRGG